MDEADLLGLIEELNRFFPGNTKRPRWVLER
jgi:hypothetical protein